MEELNKKNAELEKEIEETNSAIELNTVKMNERMEHNQKQTKEFNQKEEDASQQREIFQLKLGKLESVVQQIQR